MLMARERALPWHVIYPFSLEGSLDLNFEDTADSRKLCKLLYSSFVLIIISQKTIVITYLKTNPTLFKFRYYTDDSTRYRPPSIYLISRRPANAKNYNSAMTFFSSASPYPFSPVLTPVLSTSLGTPSSTISFPYTVCCTKLSLCGTK